MGLIWTLAAAFWGFAEATLFFTVPDVLLTYAVIRFGLRRAVPLAVYTLSGALLGGWMMYRWGLWNIESARETLDAVPLVSQAMIARAGEELRGDVWMVDMVIGALTGLPYKVYAVEAAGAGIPAATFALASIPVRLARWLLTMALTAAIVAVLRRFGTERIAVPLWAGMWTTFYIAFYLLMPG